MDAHWLLLATLCLGLFGAGQVWLVQLSSYPLWRFVGPHEFEAYHWAWWRSIWGPVLSPAVLTFAGAALMLRWPPPGAPAWAAPLGMALQALLVLGTAAWWGPLMARIQADGGGLDPGRYRLLMTTHWLRVALVTGFALLLIWMTAASGWAAA